VIVDKITSQPRRRIGAVVGRLSVQQLQTLDRALALWLGGG
jgi:hypothetical protein